MTDLIQTDDTFDKIEKYYRSNGQLTAKEMEICQRWELAFATLTAQLDKKVAVSKYIAVLKKKGTSLSIAQAYRDMSAAEKLFTPLKKYQKEYLRLVVIEAAIKDAKRADQLAAQTKDPKQWAEIMKIKDKAQKRIIEAGGLNVTDPNLPDFSKLQSNQFNIVLDPTTLGMLQKMTQQGTVDATALYMSMEGDDEAAFIIEDRK